MGAEKVEKYLAVCDNCGVILDEMSEEGIKYWHDADEAVNSAHRAGWQVGKKMQLYCPGCVKKVKKNGKIILHPPKEVYLQIKTLPIDKSTTSEQMKE